MSLPNVLWILLDDISTERFPEYGNEALVGLLPGWERLKMDGAVYYEHFYSPSSLCAPSQVALFSGLEPADIGGQYQFSTSNIAGKKPYATVPPPNVKFVPEVLRAMGYWSVGGGKLDYQVADVIPTFYNVIRGGFFSDTTSYQDSVWDPAIALGRPFFGMLNMMDMHQAISTYSREAPIPISHPNVETPLPFGPFGFTRPLSLAFRGPQGDPIFPPVNQINLETTDIVGYGGSFNETSLSHANGGVPGYLPDEIGIKSILAREYDLIRNADYRILKIIEALEDRGVYNETMIVVFGDHGSGTYKAKALLEPQSLRTPLWIKYPANTFLPEAVKIESASDGTTYKVDDRMTSILDLFPTTLSVIGVPPPEWIKVGVPLAGNYASETTREILYAIIQRGLALTGLKSFAAFTKDFFYQRHMVTASTITAFAESLLGGEVDEALGTIPADSILARRFTFLSASPIFDRLRRLLRVNGEDLEFVEQYGTIAADDATAPSEVLYDLRTDPYGTRNLIIEYTYNVTISDTIQPWGNNVTKISVEYGPLDETNLTLIQSSALAQLRSGLDNWIMSQRWVEPEFDFREGGFAEENAMAEVFWPGGVQPITSPVEIESFNLSSNNEDIVAFFRASTPGTVTRYSIATPDRRSQCEQLGSEAKQKIPRMSISNSGLAVTEYTSPLNQRNYTGFHYEDMIVLTNIFGSSPGCGVFVSETLTYMELSCPGDSVFAFDTRDSSWNGTTWIGVDEETGDWMGEPIPLFNPDTNGWNPSAFHPYIYGPLRSQIFSGLNEDGTTFVPIDGNPSQIPLNIGIPPPPRYWISDNDVNRMPERIFSSQSLSPSGWSFFNPASYYRSEATDGLDNKGSFRIELFYRQPNPGLFDRFAYTFNSFDYECLLWEVGDQASIPLDVLTNNSFHIFTQGVRKGYEDSSIVEEHVTIEDLLGIVDTEGSNNPTQAPTEENGTIEPSSLAPSAANAIGPVNPQSIGLMVLLMLGLF